MTMCHNVFNVWPKTILPVRPRDTTSLGASGRTSTFRSSGPTTNLVPCRTFNGSPFALHSGAWWLTGETVTLSISSRRPASGLGADLPFGCGHAAKVKLSASDSESS